MGSVGSEEGTGVRVGEEREVITEKAKARMKEVKVILFSERRRPL